MTIIKIYDQFFENLSKLNDDLQTLRISFLFIKSFLKKIFDSIFSPIIECKQKKKYSSARHL